MAKQARFRTRGAIPPSAVCTEQTAPVNSGVVGPKFTSVSLPVPENGLYEAMRDVVTDTFNKRVANGEIIFNPMEKVVRQQSGSGSGYKIRVLNGSTAGTVYTAEGNWALLLGRRAFKHNAIDDREWVPSIPPGAVEALERGVKVASTQALRLPSDAQLLVAMAEMRQTLSLVPGVLKGWRDLFRRINAREESFSRKRSASRPYDAVRNLRDTENVLVDTWLAMRFGARPLVSDTLGVLKALKRARSGEIVRATQRGRAEWSSTERRTAVSEFGILKTPVSMQNEDHFTVRAMSIWEAKIALLDDVGVNLSHVPEAAIDLLKFSFVLNWVVNLNDFCAALGASANPYWTNYGGVYVVRRESSTLITAEAGSSLTNSNYSLDRPVEGWAMTSTRSTSRVVGLKAPSLVLRPNPYDWMGDLRLLDAIALVRQQIRGKGVSILARMEQRSYRRKAG